MRNLKAAEIWKMLRLSFFEFFQDSRCSGHFPHNSTYVELTSHEQCNSVTGRISDFNVWLYLAC